MKVDQFALLDNAAWPALMVDSSGRIRSANRKAADILGAVVTGSNPSLSAVWAKGNDQPWAQFLGKVFQTRLSTTPMHLIAKGGQSQEFTVHIAPVSIANEKLQLFQLFKPEPAAGNTTFFKNPLFETSLLQKQKLECALQLARTVALDFNNALTSILGYSSHLLNHMETGNPLREALMEIEKSAERAAEVASDLAAFSRQEKDARTQSSGNIGNLLRQVVETVQSHASKSIQWDLSVSPSLHSAHYDEAKLQQAIIKVIENAVESMDNGGTIKIQVDNCKLSPEETGGDSGSAPSSHISIKITDEGEGISEEVLPRIFEPFFTTREGHRGLGLAWVYGIVTNHGGRVTVDSQPGNGTSVAIYLPATSKTAADQSIQDDQLTGTSTILLVDDEDLVLTFGETILSAYGYRVRTATSGTKALAVLKEESAPFDLLITDMVMPNMNGRQLIEQVRAMAPSTRILCASGYERPDAGDSSLSYIQKPFTSKQLLAAVKKILS